MRCGWCGQFVRADTQPMVGLNYYGEPRSQVLCPAHQNDWRYLAAYNVLKGGRGRR